LHHKLPVFGYRIGDFTYLTDLNYIAEDELTKVYGTKVLVLDALQRLAALPPGWDSFGSKPLHAAAVRRLLSLAPVLLPPDGPEPSVIPTRHGGVQLEWHRSGVDLEVEVPPSDPITFLYADATAQEEREGIGAPNQDLVVRAFSKMISAI